jgi:thiol:disulfide interchange protein DsbC
MDKSRHIWCAKDPAKAWQDHMTRDTAPTVASCDSSVLMRNVEFGRKHKISGTPTLLAQDGKRVPGAIPLAQIEQLIASKP